MSENQTIFSTDELRAMAKDESVLVGNKYRDALTYSADKIDNLHKVLHVAAVDGKPVDDFLKKAVESFIEFAGRENAQLVVEVLKENMAMISAFVDIAAKQGVTNVASQMSKLVGIDADTISFINDVLKEGGAK